MVDISSTVITVLATAGLTTLGIFFVVNYAINTFQKNLLGFFNQGIVKKGMSILGKKSGEARRNKALENELAGGVIDNLIGKWKLPLSLIGVDIDELLAKYEPMELLGAFQTFMPMLKQAGIDVNKLVGQFTEPQTSNSELGNIGT